MVEVCTCKICVSRMAVGQDPLPGISTCKEFHLIEEPSKPKKISGNLFEAKPKPPAPAPVTRKELTGAIERSHEVLADVIGDALAEITKDIEAAQAATQTHIKRLESRVAELEAHIKELQRKHVDFGIVGPWREDASYKKNNLVVYHGGLWACLSPTSDRPPSPNWKLVVQRGAVDRPLDDNRPTRRQPTMQRSTPR